MKFSAVLFDLDGTLLDTLTDLAEAMNSVLLRFNLPVHNIEDYKYFVGDGIENLVKRAIPQTFLNNEKLIKESIILMKKEYELNWNKTTKPYDGIIPLLNNLKEMNIITAVLSNKPDNFTKRIIKKMFIGHDFKSVIGAGAEFPNKPDPSGALFTAEFLKIKPEGFIYLGDTNTDMLTAVNAGMFPAGALWGFRTKEELIASGAKKVIDKPLDLIKIFEKI
jgi:phosphoglycolate phosphatase